jgi:hypothetical protein
MPDRHVTVVTLADPAEADLMRTRLEAEGIPVLLLGDTSATVFAGLGNKVAGIHVQVPEAEAERARAFLAAERASLIEEKQARGIPLTEAGRTAWVCPTCGTRVDQDIDLCPSCGTVIPVPDEAAADEQPADEREPPTAIGDRLANRTLVAAVFGLFFCQGLLHLYSLWVLWKLRGFPGGVTSTGRWKAYVALCIDVLVLFVVLPVLLRVLLLLLVT